MQCEIREELFHRLPTAKDGDDERPELPQEPCMPQQHGQNAGGILLSETVRNIRHQLLRRLNNSGQFSQQPG